ncbi:MFS transporter [Pseudomonas sp. NPDC089406]|uniref:MFS transporter n=1 Tax=Pseudomonas sp. NPDC089406 TaxID=3364463 RepID=UPI00384EC9FF
MNPPVTPALPLFQGSRLFLLPLVLIACLAGMVGPMPLAMMRFLPGALNTGMEGVWSLTGSYHLALALALPLLGYCCDRVQRRRLLLSALVMLAASALAMACSSNLGLAMASRVLAGIATAAILPAVLAIVADLLAPTKRVAALGLVVMGITLGTLLTPMVVGILAQSLGWQGPLVLLAAGCLGVMLLAARWLPRAPTRQVAQAAAGASGRRPLLRPLLALCAWYGVGTLGLMVSSQLLMSDLDFTLQQALYVSLGHGLGMAAGNLGAGWVRQRLGRDEDQVLLAVLLLALSVLAFVLLPRSFQVALGCLGIWGLALGLGLPAGLAVLVGRAGAGAGKVLGGALGLSALVVLGGLPLALWLLMIGGTAALGVVLVAGVGLGVCLVVADWWVTR